MVFGAAVVLSIISFFIIRSILIGQMSNVAHEAAADRYLQQDTFHLTREHDRYLYTHTKVTKKAKKNKNDDD